MSIFNPEMMDSQLKDWVTKQIETLKKGNPIVINGVGIINLLDFATELKKSFAEADEKDDQFTSTFGRMRAHIIERQQHKDNEIIFSTLCKLLEPYEIFILEAQRLNDLEDAAISAWEWNKNAVRF